MIKKAKTSLITLLSIAMSYSRLVTFLFINSLIIESPQLLLER